MSLVQPPRRGIVALDGHHVDVEGMLDGYVTPGLEAEQTADNGALLTAEGVSGYVVGNCKQDKGVEDDLEFGAGLSRDESIGSWVG